VVGDVLTSSCLLITTVDGAQHAVVTRHGNTWLAHLLFTPLCAVAEEPVIAICSADTLAPGEAARLRIADLALVTEAVFRDEEALRLVIVALVDRTIDLVHASRSRTGEATPERTALDPIAEDPVVAVIVRNTLVLRFGIRIID
jgi:hypothetical protein